MAKAAKTQPAVSKTARNREEIRSKLESTENGATSETQTVGTSHAEPAPHDEDSGVSAKTIKENANIKLTVNGQPIPIHLAHAIPFANTDQGIAAREAERIAKNDALDPNWRDKPNVKLGASAEERLMLGRYDGDDEEIAVDSPLDALIAKHRRPGFSPKWLKDPENSKVSSHESADASNYRPVVDENGRPVKLSEMYLGERPTEDVHREKLRRSRMTDNSIQRIEAEQQERVKKAGQGPHLQPVAAGSALTDGQGGTAPGGFRAVIGNPDQLDQQS